MYLTEVEEKQITLYESVFDSDLRMLENINSTTLMESVYDDVYYEDGDSILKKASDFFKALIEKFKKFVESVTNAVKEKIAKFKSNRIIDKIEKSGIKTIKNVKIKGIDARLIKELKKEGTEFVKLSAKSAKKLRNAKTIEEVTKIQDEINEEYEKLMWEQTKDKKKSNLTFISDLDFDPLSVCASAWISEITTETSMRLEEEAIKNEVYLEKLNQDKSKIQKMIEDVFNNDDSSKKVEECNEDIQVTKQKTNVLKNLGVKTTSFFKNMQSKFTKSHLAILGAIATAAAAGVAGKKVYDNHKAVSESVEETSVDMDYLFDELCESASDMFEEEFNAYEAAISDTGFDSENFFEGTNLDCRAHFKEFKKEHNTYIRKYRAQIKSGKYKEAIDTLKILKKKNNDYMKKIYDEVDTAGSIAFGFFLTAGLPFLLRSIISSLTALLIPGIGMLASFATGIATMIERINAIIDDCKRENRNLTIDDANMYKNGIKVKMKEYNMLYDKLIEKVQKRMQAEKQAVKESADLQDYYDTFFTATESVEDDEHSGYDSFDDILSDLDMEF